MFVTFNIIQLDECLRSFLLGILMAGDMNKLHEKRVALLYGIGYGNVEVAVICRGIVGSLGLWFLGTVDVGYYSGIVAVTTHLCRLEGFVARDVVAQKDQGSEKTHGFGAVRVDVLFRSGGKALTSP